MGAEFVDAYGERPLLSVSSLHFADRHTIEKAHGNGVLTATRLARCSGICVTGGGIYAFHCFRYVVIDALVDFGVFFRVK